MKPNDILTWYENYSPEQHGIEQLITMRQHLSIACVRIAEKIGEMEKQHKVLYADRKTIYAEQFLLADGTAAERSEIATKKTKEIRSQEAEVEGRLRGAKLYIDALFKVQDSMSSWINASRN